MDITFPSTYEESRARFLRDVDVVRAKWPFSRLEAHPLKNHPDLSIDWLWAEPHNTENLVIVSTGQHGIEGYVGSAILKLFMDEFAPRLNPANTGLLLIHGINPWGMKHWRRVNENNVDLNRNFVYGVFDEGINLDFKTLAYLLTPQHPAGAFWLENLLFCVRVVRAFLALGVSRIATAALLGQYHTPKGFFYGGTQHEESTTVMMELFQQASEDYNVGIPIDIHTGYGPRYQMSITIHPREPISSGEASAAYHYPLVKKINQKEFYDINGDMGDYYYKMRNEKFPNKQLFARGFEFGTLGDSLLARLRSLRAMVLENQLFWNGAVDEGAADSIRKEFRELYFPTSEDWRAKALADGGQAFEGILRAYQLI